MTGGCCCSSKAVLRASVAPAGARRLRGAAAPGTGSTRCRTGRPRKAQTKPSAGSRMANHCCARRYNLSVYPEVRVYADPYEELTAQLTQLRGLIKLVPPLIEADRHKRWEEISSRPSDGDDGDVIDVYSEEAGPKENRGFAHFDHTIYLAAVVTSQRGPHSRITSVARLKKSCLRHDLSEHPVLTKLVQEDVRNWGSPFRCLGEALLRLRRGGLEGAARMGTRQPRAVTAERADIRARPATTS